MTCPVSNLQLAPSEVAFHRNPPPFFSLQKVSWKSMYLLKILQGLPSDFRIKSKYFICLNNLSLNKVLSSYLLLISLAPFSASPLLYPTLTEGGDYGIPDFNIVIHWLPNPNLTCPRLQKAHNPLAKVESTLNNYDGCVWLEPVK